MSYKMITSFHDETRTVTLHEDDEGHFGSAISIGNCGRCFCH